MLEILGSIYRELRRRYYFRFKKDYVRKSIAKRKGKCGMHGCCATMSRVFRPFLGCKWQEGNVCKMWRDNGWDALPERCRMYPFDEKDKTPFSKKYCNFHWEVSYKNKEKTRRIY